MAEDFSSFTPLPTRREGSSGKAIVLTALVAFLIGAGGMGYLAWSGQIAVITDKQAEQAARTAPLAGLPAANATAHETIDSVRDGALDTRIAALEQRLVQIDLRSAASSGNSARAEAMLIAFAARRTLDKGAPLGYLEEQLRLRFADSQPNAVKTLIDTAHNPVTLDGLLSGLDRLAPSLGSASPEQAGTWMTLRNQIASLFVVRSEPGSGAAPSSRVERARLALEAGRVGDAVNEVRALPGAAGAKTWIADAERYGRTRDALDLIETTALLDTRNLHDGQGRAVQQPSPAVPAD